MTIAVLHPNAKRNAATHSPITAERLKALLDAQKQAYREAGAPTAEQRRSNLQKLLRAVLANQDRIADAISQDFGHRSDVETRMAEIFTTVESIRHARRNVKGWMKPERHAVNLAFLPARAKVLKQPLGTVGVISPWNYPFYLAIDPLVGALAAGNRVMIKPSEFTPKTSTLLAEMIEGLFEPEEVVVVQGGQEVGEQFSRLPFDHLLFTGATKIGHHVMRAAAENLTPVTLELGGKSPAIVAPGYAMDRAAGSIVAGKMLNAGQTCIAPDYVLVPESNLDSFVAHARQKMAGMYPNLAANPDYTSVMGDRNYARLRAHLDDAAEKGAQVVTINPAGEGFENSAGKMAPTLVLQPTDGMTVMQEEIFGPILPVLTYRDLGEAIDYVNDHDRPLALYYFDTDSRRINRVLKETVSGGVTVNDTLFHIAQDNLPFGGVGASGMGHYHGRDGFETFTKRKSVFYQSRLNGAGLLRPPYGRLVRTLLKTLIGGR